MDTFTLLVTELISTQFPQWANLPIQPIAHSGIDNRTFRLGEDMLIRMPSSKDYAAQVPKEQKWLPILAPYLTYPIPKPIALGQPSHSYPWHWSIYQWLDGESANTLTLKENSLANLAGELGLFLTQLHKIDPAGGPLPGLHNYWRGDHPSVYDTETRVAIKKLAPVIDTKQAIAIWEIAITSHWQRNPVWIHGDFSSGNILVKDEKLSAIIDFGCMGIGDPACDLVIAWTLLTKKSRQVFRELLDLDEKTWARARGWALWKASITLARLANKTSLAAIKQRQIIHDVLDDYTASQISSLP